MSVRPSPAPRFPQRARRRTQYTPPPSRAWINTLSTTDHNAAPSVTTPAKSNAWKVALRVFSFVLAFGLLAYAASIAFSADNKEHLAKLKNASVTSVGALLGLSLLSLTINGIIFNLTIRPVQRLSIASNLATNALAAFLAYIPLKLSILLRIGIHTRRDQVPLARVGGWFAAVALLLLSTIGAMSAVCFYHRTIDAMWFALIAGALATVATTIILLARTFAGERGLLRLQSLVPGSSTSLPKRMLRSERFRQLHSALDMLASPRHVVPHMLLRVADIAVQAARVPIAASIIGLSLPYGDAFLIATTAFIVGIISPSGPVGAREATVINACTMLQIPEAKAFAVVTLVVTSAEVVAYATGALAGLLYLGPSRLFVPPRNAKATPQQ